MTAMFREAAQTDVHALLPSVRTPTLVVHRQSDRQMPPEVSAGLAAAFPTAGSSSRRATDPPFSSRTCRRRRARVPVRRRRDRAETPAVPVTTDRNGLTPREREALRLFAGGGTNAGIARSARHHRAHRRAARRQPLPQDRGARAGGGDRIRPPARLGLEAGPARGNPSVDLPGRRDPATASPSHPGAMTATTTPPVGRRPGPTEPQRLRPADRRTSVVPAVCGGRARGAEVGPGVRGPDRTHRGARPVRHLPAVRPGGTNWARNVIAAGGCNLRWKGEVHHGSEPLIVGRDDALPLANRFERFMIPRLGFEDFLLLQR